MLTPTPPPAHTPKPETWRYTEVIGGCFVEDSDGNQILAWRHSPSPEHRAKARLIVKAVNSHAALVEALAECEPHLRRLSVHDGDVDTLPIPSRMASDKARAALDSATPAEGDE